MTSSDPLFNAVPDLPVFGSAQFTGRRRLAQNLLGRCLRRQSILLYGGPKLGKTSLLLHLKWLIDQDCKASPAMPEALYVDLSDRATLEHLLVGRWPSPSLILLLDNCDRVIKENPIDKVQKFIKSASAVHATVWAGQRLWHDFARDHGCSSDLRPVPLAVLLQGEASELLKLRLTSNQTAAALSVGGTHPYVLKVLAHYMLSLQGDPMSAIPGARDHLIPFFQACHQAIRQGPEEALLKYLIQGARPVNTREASVAIGVATIKSVADALCCIGLISRWNLNEGAMLQANCRIFNDWYLATAPIIHH